jgi:hypothetical protein
MKALQQPSRVQKLLLTPRTFCAKMASTYLYPVRPLAPAFVELKHLSFHRSIERRAKEHSVAWQRVADRLAQRSCPTRALAARKTGSLAAATAFRKPLT